MAPVYRLYHFASRPNWNYRRRRRRRRPRRPPRPRPRPPRPPRPPRRPRPRPHHHHHHLHMPVGLWISYASRSLDFFAVKFTKAFRNVLLD